MTLMLTTGPPGKTRGCVFKPNSGTLCVLGSDGKEFTCSVGDPGSIPGLGRSLGGGHSNPLQYSCWENPMDFIIALSRLGLQRVEYDCLARVAKSRTGLSN